MIVKTFLFLLGQPPRPRLQLCDPVPDPHVHGLVVSHDLAVVLDPRELAGVDKEWDVVGLERREHARKLRDLNVGRPELELKENEVHACQEKRGRHFSVAMNRVAAHFLNTIAGTLYQVIVSQLTR